MKTILLTSLIAFGLLISTNSKAANIEITDMLFINGPGGFEQPLAATGNLYSDGSGSLTADLFLGELFTATQETMFMDNTGLWSGTTGSTSAAVDAFDYDDEIAAMSNEQIAVGLFFEWNNNPMAVLAIFECTGFGTVENPFDCTGVDPVIMDNGVFIGSIITLNAAVPVPAAVWLMGSGLLGLIGVARRHKFV